MDTAIDFAHITELGAIFGSGGLIVLDEDTCMVEMARFFVNFTQLESCGKCPPCRLGTLQMLKILDKIIDGRGAVEDLAKLESIAGTIAKASLCGLGQTAPNPVLTTLRYFRDEYEAHINGKCPALVCKKMIQYDIVPEKCTGCGLCAKNCGSNAISGTLKQPHKIDPKTCIKCGMCIGACPSNAIIKVPQKK
jgi:ferredoxin